MSQKLTDEDREALTRLLDDFPASFHQENPVEKKFMATFNPWRMRKFPFGQGKMKKFVEVKPLPAVIQKVQHASALVDESYVADFEEYTFKSATHGGHHQVEITVGLAYDYVLEATLIMVPDGWRKLIDELAPLVSHQRKHYMEVVKYAAIDLVNKGHGYVQHLHYPDGQKFLFMGTHLDWDIYSRRQLQEAHDLIDEKETKAGLLHLKEIRDARLSF